MQPYNYHIPKLKFILSQETALSLINCYDKINFRLTVATVSGLHAKHCGINEHGKDPLTIMISEYLIGMVWPTCTNGIAYYSLFVLQVPLNFVKCH